MSKNKKINVLISELISWILSRFYIFLFLIVERLPLHYADRLGRFSGGILFYLTSRRRKVVEKNISTLKAWAENRNLKNKLLDQCNRKIAKNIYQSNAGNFFYSFSLMNKSISTISEHIKLNDYKAISKAYSENKGVLILFAHSGPFELTVMLPRLLPSIFSGEKVAAMFRPFSNKYINNWYLKKRERFGSKLLSRDDGFLKIIRHIKNGGFINIAFDIRMRQGEKIELFDRLASTSKIPYTLHKATQAPVFIINYIKTNDLSWEIQFKEIVSSEHGICSEIELLKAANEHLEQIVFENPYDYFFFQNRYK